MSLEKRKSFSGSSLADLRCLIRIILIALMSLVEGLWRKTKLKFLHLPRHLFTDIRNLSDTILSKIF